MEERNPVDRLTGREKEALRLWLEHKTAKQIALDLGVSHFAVEKRLKSARLKLGVTSSLDAARLLAEAEGYGRMGAHTADMDVATVMRQRWATPQTIGVVAVLIIASAVLAFALQSQNPADRISTNEAYTQGESGDRPNRAITDLDFIPATPERVEAYVRSMFNQRDRDRSGFVERAEAPELLQTMKPGGGPEFDAANVAETLRGEAAQAQYIANVDKDGDGRVSFEEFATPVRPQFLRRGIPLIPADWRPIAPDPES